jgi:hypothetical protein
LTYRRSPDANANDFPNHLARASYKFIAGAGSPLTLALQFASGRSWRGIPRHESRLIRVNTQLERLRRRMI